MPQQQLAPDPRYIPDLHCRVTVVGRRRRVDLAVPANAPIAEYVMTVARLCGEPDDVDGDYDYGHAAPVELGDTAPLPPAWSLALTGSGPLPPESSLAAMGITDGQVLYLRDAWAGAADEAVVTDVGESVAEAAERVGRAWTSRARAATWLCGGGGWLAVTIAAFGILSDRRPAPVAPGHLGLLGIATAILSAALAGFARQRTWRLPTWLLTTLAASAIPELAVAGAMLASAHATAPQIALGATAGAVIGALLALAAMPGAITGGLLAVGLLSLAVAGCLAALHADGPESAGVVAVAALWLYDQASASVARLVALASPRRAAGPVATLVNEQVRQAQQLVAAWQSVLAVTEALALSWLADSTQTYAFVLACCVALALLLAASCYRQLTSVLPGTAAGAVGMLAVLLLVPGRLGAPRWTGAVICCVIGFTLLVSGISQSFREETLPEPPAWRGPLAAVLRVASIPLLVGVFGAFGHLVTVGRGL
jgi:type VII secretion integral membrane protein EccD